jgi:hypothetical protein
MDGISKLLDRASLVAFLFLGGLGLAVLGHYKSAQPPLLFGWSTPYVVFVLAPTLFLFLFQIALLTTPKLRKFIKLNNPTFCIICGMLFLSGSLIWIKYLPTYHASVLGSMLVILLAILVMTIWLDRYEFMLTYLGLTILGGILFSFEIPVLTQTRSTHPLVRWGDENTFQYLFPQKPPFIGPGGRLRPSVHYRLATLGGDDLGVRFVTNKLGFRNQEDFSPNPKPNELRILNLGDSFACGYGIDQESFFGPVIERLLQTQLPNQKVLVMNAEVSDPAYGLYYLQNFGKGYSPKVVIYGLFAGNDIFQTHIGSGHKFSTFMLDDSGNMIANPEANSNSIKEFLSELLKMEAYSIPANLAWEEDRMKEKSWSVFFPTELLMFREIIYLKRFFHRTPHTDSRLLKGELMSSYVKELERSSRKKSLLEPVHTLGLFYRKQLVPVEQMYQIFFRVIEVMNADTRKTGAEFGLVYFPQRFQVQPQDWKALQDRWKLDANEFDLDQPNNQIGQFSKEHNIHYYDLTPVFREDAKKRNLYLPHDGHFNEFGHTLAAREVSLWIYKILLNLSRGSHREP